MSHISKTRFLRSAMISVLPRITSAGTAALLILFLLSCRGGGIFAYVATTDKIDLGLLPEGLGASKLMEIRNEYDDTSPSPYTYFSSGPAFYRRNTKNRSDSKTAPWEKISLPSGWTNIQSIAVSDDRILMCLARESSGSMEVGLYYYSATGSFEEITMKEGILTGETEKYNTVILYCPKPDGNVDTFYVNILEYSGKFAQEIDFNGSALYLLDDGGEELSKEAPDDWKSVLKDGKSYITGAAFGNNVYRFTTIDPEDKTGQITDETGNQIAPSITNPTRSLTWLPGSDEQSGTNWPEKGVFIMSGWKLDETTYPLYISADGSTWTTLSSNFRYSSFLSVIGTAAGSSPNKLILAGTRNAASTTTGNGYMEIVADDADPEQWDIRTDKNSFTFAQTGTYIASDLSDDSIIGFSLFEGYVYASTDDDAVWRINADDKTTHEGSGLVWTRE